MGLIQLALGEQAMAAGSLIQAAGHLDRAQRLLPTGGDRPEVLAVLDAQMRLHAANRQWTQAIAAGEGMLDLLTRRGGTDQQPYVEVLGRMAQVWVAAGDPQRALACNERIVAIIERRFGGQEPNLAAALRNGAGLARLAGDEAQAGSYEQRANRIGAP
jgi:tetratricopeptide (TPR) repeat protein